MNRSLRILQIVSGDLWAGAEVQAFTLMRSLHKMAHIEVAAVLFNDGTLADKLKEAGILVYPLNELNVSSLSLLIRVREIIDGWRPDVIHTHRTKENIIGSIANRTKYCAPCIRTVHGANERPVEKGLQVARQRIISGLDRWCGTVLQDRIIAVSRDLGDKLATQFPADKIIVIENGVDVEAVKREKALGLCVGRTPDVIHVGIVGRLSAVKRVDLFLETAALLLRHHRNEMKWQFHVIGDGPLRQELEARARHLRIAESVLFYGHRRDVLTCIDKLDVLVNCSDHEGLPMSVLEAMALEVPTVAHAVGGLIDVLPKEFLIDLHNPAGYRDGILRALAGDGRAITVGNATKKLQFYSAQKNAMRVRALYGELIQSSRRSTE